jgi:hypothetical protein
MKRQHCKQLRAFQCPVLEGLAPRAGSSHSALAPNSFTIVIVSMPSFYSVEQNLISGTCSGGESLDVPNGAGPHFKFARAYPAY